MKKIEITPETKYISMASWVRWKRPFIHFWKYYECKLKRRGLKILDLGCGVGFSLYDSDPQDIIIGVEIVKEAADKAIGKVKSNIVLADAAMLPFRSSVFDVVTAFDLLEHVPKPELVISEAFRVLKNGGFFVFTTPSKIGVSGDPTHISEKEPYEWKEILLNVGFIPRIYYVPALITMYLLVKFIPKIWGKLRLLNVATDLFRIICLLEEPLRKLLGIIYGKLGTRLYVEAKKP